MNQRQGSFDVLFLVPVNDLADRPENAEAEQLFQGLRASTTELEVRNITHGLQRVFLDDPPAIFLAWNQRSRAVRREFGVQAEPDTDPILSLWRWGADKQAETLALR